MLEHIQNARVLALILLLATAVAVAADEGEPTWYETFDGHEMWMTSLDDALAAASKADKPLLIDLFSPT